jgi:hypothetical protein
MFKPRRKQASQSEFWVVADRLPKATPSRFYELLNETLARMNFAEQVWAICAGAYAEAERGGRPGIDPVTYFKMLMVGFLKASRANAKLRYVVRIRYPCAAFSAIASMKQLRITRVCP